MTFVIVCLCVVSGTFIGIAVNRFLGISSL